MKKLILLSICCLTMATCNLTYAQDTISKPVLASLDTGKVTFTRVYKDVKNGLAGLAAGLKTGVEHVYTILVRQQIINSVTDLSILILLFIGIMVLIKNFRKFYGFCRQKDHPWYNHDADDHIIIYILGFSIAILSILSLLVFANNINTVISGFFNPEYGAIKEVVNFIK